MGQKIHRLFFKRKFTLLNLLLVICLIGVISIITMPATCMAIARQTAQQALYCESQSPDMTDGKLGIVYTDTAIRDTDQTPAYKPLP